MFEYRYKLWECVQVGEKLLLFKTEVINEG